MSRFDAVMFDLDGTLADTLADIAAGGNHVLAHFGRTPIALPRYRYLAGQGARYLVREALQLPDDDPRVDRGVEVFRAWQLKHGMDLTTPYPGIAALLDGLVDRKLRLAVLSNKPDAATKMMIQHKFSRWRFDAVVGHVDGVPLKPDPASALRIAERLAVAPARWLYVGDTRVDMQTANRAGFFAVGVLWGFRDEPELRESGARVIVSEPTMILDLLDA